MSDNPFADLIPASPTQASKDNPFADLIPADKGGNPAAAPKVEPTLVQKAEANAESVSEKARRQMGSFLSSLSETSADFITGAKRQTDAMAEGAFKLAGQLSGSKRMIDVADKNTAQGDANLRSAIDRSPVASRLGEWAGIAGVVAPQIAYGPASALGQGVLSAGLSFLTNNQRGVDSTAPGGLGARAMDAVQSGVIGGGIAAGANKLAPYIYRGLGMGNQLAADVAEEMTPAGAKVMRQAEDLGTFVTPGEATGLKSMQAAEGRIPVTAETQAMAEGALGARESLLKGKLKGLVDSVVPEGKAAAVETKNALYTKSLGTSVPEEEAAALLSNPVIARVAQKLESDPINAMDKLKGTVGYFDQIKRELDDTTKVLLKEGRGNQAGTVKEALNSLKGSLDNLSPEYAQAREISQRLILQNGMEQNLSKIKLSPGQDSPTLDQLYSSLAGTGKSRESLYKAVQAGGGDVDEAKTVVDFINTVRNSPISKLANKNTEDVSVKMGGDITGRIIDWTKGIVNGRYNKQLLKIALDPDKREFIKAALKKAEGAQSLGGYARPGLDEALAMLTETEDRRQSGTFMQYTPPS